MSLREVLAGVPVFRDFPPEYLDRLADCAVQEDYPAESTLAREGDEAAATYLLLEGDVVIEVQGPGGPAGVLESLHGGDLVGWSWMLGRGRWLFDAVTRTPVSAIRFEARCLKEEMDQDHEFGYLLLRTYTNVVAERLRSARVRLLDLYGHDD